MITKMNRENVGVISLHVREALQKVADMHGLALEVGGGSFDPLSGEYRPKVTFKLKVDESGVDQAQKDFAFWAPQFGLVASDYRREVQINGLTYRLLGFQPSRSRYPIYVERLSDGKRVLFDKVAVRYALRPGFQEVPRG